MLAHNEQKHIADTVEALIAESHHLNSNIKVYANGCTDATETIVKKIAHNNERVSLRILPIASKTNAWNTAFRENTHKVLIFSDGDIIPEDDAINTLWEVMVADTSDTILAGCSFMACGEKLPIEKRFVGFLQIPLSQDFLSGQLYAVNRNYLQIFFNKYGISEIPLGLVGEDLFLEKIVPRRAFKVISKKVFYEPPCLKDYWKYLARMQWQEEQLTLILDDIYKRDPIVGQEKLMSKLVTKITNSQMPGRLFLGTLSSGLRNILKIVFKKRIQRHYLEMGPISIDGHEVLSKLSRASSVK